MMPCNRGLFSERELFVIRVSLCSLTFFIQSISTCSASSVSTLTALLCYVPPTRPSSSLFLFISSLYFHLCYIIFLSLVSFFFSMAFAMSFLCFLLHSAFPSCFPLLYILHVFISSFLFDLLNLFSPFLHFSPSFISLQV